MNLKLKIKSFSDKMILLAQNFRWQEISIVRKIALIFGLVLIFIFPLSAFIAHNINDNTSLNSDKAMKNLFVHDMIYLIDREVVENG